MVENGTECWADVIMEQFRNCLDQMNPILHTEQAGAGWATGGARRLECLGFRPANHRKTKVAISCPVWNQPLTDITDCYTCQVKF